MNNSLFDISARFEVIHDCFVFGFLIRRWVRNLPVDYTPITLLVRLLPRISYSRSRESKSRRANTEKPCIAGSYLRMFPFRSPGRADLRLPPCNFVRLDSSLPWARRLASILYQQRGHCPYYVVALAQNLKILILLQAFPIRRRP
jgi:hypothetical protein